LAAGVAAVPACYGGTALAPRAAGRHDAALRMSTPTLKDRPESSLVIGLVCGFVALAILVIVLRIVGMPSGFFGLVHGPQASMWGA
jgi:hypothetical protein